MMCQTGIDEQWFTQRWCAELFGMVQHEQPLLSVSSASSQTYAGSSVWQGVTVQRAELSEMLQPKQRAFNLLAYPSSLEC